MYIIQIQFIFFISVFTLRTFPIFEYLQGNKCYINQSILNQILFWDVDYDNLFHFNHLEIMPQYGNFSDFDINYQKVLGSGGFSKVYYGRQISTSIEVAIKELKEKTKWRNIIREVEILKKLKSVQNIAHFVDYIRNPQKNVSMLCIEYVKGKILNQEVSYLSEEEVIYHSYGLLEVLAQAHQLNIIHRDIKFDNIVINRKTDDMKLLDWGQAFPYIPGEIKYNQGSTPNYRAPEIILNNLYKTHITPAIDVWAAGICILRLIVGKSLFNMSSRENDQLLISQMELFGYKKYQKLSAQMNVNFNITVYKELSYKKKFPKYNSPFDNLSNYKNTYVNDQAIDLLKKLLSVNPADRITAKEALKHKYFDIIRDDEIKQN